MRTLSQPALILPAATFATALAIATTAYSPAQAVVYTSRNGANLASCGPLFGPSVLHRFLTPTATNDSLAVSDPGGTTGSIVWSSSAATARLTATAAASGLSLAVNGGITRGSMPGFGIWTLADTRDEWVFTISAPTRFTLQATLTTASSEATVPPSHFTFGGLGLVPDPGSPPPPYQRTLNVPGTVTLAASGTLMPGTYLAMLFGRAEGTTYPFTGSYDNTMVVTFQPAAVATARQAFGNPNSYTCSAPVLGQTWNASVDVGATGHALAVVFAAVSPANVPVSPGFTVLLGAPVFEFLPVAAGPVAAYTLAMPMDPTLAGFQLSTQAVHVGGSPPLLLSNAQDLTLGF